MWLPRVVVLGRDNCLTSKPLPHLTCSIQGVPTQPEEGKERGGVRMWEKERGGAREWEGRGGAREWEER